MPEFGPGHGWVRATVTGRWRFIEGLGEDMLGYIFARSNAVGVPTASNPSPDDSDHFGCGHSDDGEAAAAAEAAGDLLCSPTRRGSRSSRRADLETGEGGAKPPGTPARDRRD